MIYFFKKLDFLNQTYNMERSEYFSILKFAPNLVALEFGWMIKPKPMKPLLEGNF